MREWTRESRSWGCKRRGPADDPGTRDPAEMLRGFGLMKDGQILRAAVVLFGPTSSAEIELYGRGTKITPPGLDCLCCYLPKCDKVPHCQALIAPEVVLAAVQQWLVAR